MCLLGQGAILSQVAVTGISFDESENLHWTVNACYMVGLVCGAFSVIFACLVHPALMGLNDPRRIQEWLSQPTEQKSSKPHASAYAVMMLLAPSRLLSIAVSALLIGLGIYLGILYTNDPSTPLGHLGTLATLIAYLGCTVFGLLIFFIPRGMKAIEARKQGVTALVGQHQIPGQWSARSTRLNQSNESQHSLQGHGAPSPSEIPRVIPSNLAKNSPTSYALETLTPSQTRRDSMTSELVEEGRQTHQARADSYIVVTQQRHDSLESILQDLIAAQEQCTRATQRLLEYHQSQP